MDQDRNSGTGGSVNPSQSNPTCRTCVYWGNVETGGDHRYGHADEDARANRRICGCPKIKHNPDAGYKAEDWPDDAVEICDGSGYWGAMFPGPAYSCHHHKRRTFVCASCGNTFPVDDDWSEEEAAAEYEAVFHEKPTPTKDAQVCDNCYKAAMGLN